jgi:catechol 2,3-dioxygenase-like lactoylglutathione lyase family enzyme
MAFVADLQRSVDFYKLLGMEVRHTLQDSSGQLKWVFLACERAELMFARLRPGYRQPASRIVLSLLI